MNLVLVLFSLLTLNSFASYKGTLVFTPEELQNHRLSIRSLVDTSRNCLLGYQSRHVNFYQKNCIRTRWGKKKCLSKYYGERRYSKVQGQRRSDGQLLEWLPQVLQEEGFDPRMASYMEATSCVGLALQCLKEGFQQTGQGEQWRRIMNYVRENNVGGTALQDALQKIGWNIYYWNPVSEAYIQEATKRWDEEEKNWQSKGWHNYRYNRVISRGTYWYNQVDNSTDLVGFGDTVPTILNYYPYWVGTANTGYHVFPGTYGEVVEAHSTRHITALDNLEFSDFNPFATGGGPRWTRSEKYRSGLIALPPLF